MVARTNMLKSTGSIWLRNVAMCCATAWRTLSWRQYQLTRLTGDWWWRPLLNWGGVEQPSSPRSSSHYSTLTSVWWRSLFASVFTRLQGSSHCITNDQSYQTLNTFIYLFIYFLSVALGSGITFIKFDLWQLICAWIIAFLMLIPYVKLLPLPLTRWSWKFVVYQASRGQSLYEIWATSSNPRPNYW